MITKFWKLNDSLTLILCLSFHNFYKEFIFVIIDRINVQISTFCHFCDLKTEFDVILIDNSCSIKNCTHQELYPRCNFWWIFIKNCTMRQFLISRIVLFIICIQICPYTFIVCIYFYIGCSLDDIINMCHALYSYLVV